jgi:UrcA family protein
LDCDLVIRFGEDGRTPIDGDSKPRRRPMMNPARLAVAAAALATLSSAAFAAEPSRSVRYADLNLTSAEGRAQLDRRIAAAAEALCGFAVSADLAGQSDVARCRAATVAGVTSQRATILTSAAMQGGAIRLSAR